MKTERVSHLCGTLHRELMLLILQWTWLQIQVRTEDSNFARANYLFETH